MAATASTDTSKRRRQESRRVVSSSLLKRSAARSLPAWFLTPTILLFLGIFLYPLLMTMGLSVMKIDDFSFTGGEFIGLRNFQELLTTPLFVQSLKNIGMLWAVGGIVVFGLSFLFTALLHALPSRPRNFFRAMIFLPHIINVVAVVTLWSQYIYNPRFGFFKQFFTALHMDSLANFTWTSPDHIFWAISIAYIWASLGWYTLVIMAGADQIPPELYEAAKLEGANTGQVFFGITLPLLRGVLNTSLVMWTIHVINVFAFFRAFNPVAMTAQTYTPAVYLYELAFGSGGSASDIQVGKAAAAAVIILILSLLSANLISRLIRADQLEY